MLAKTVLTTTFFVCNSLYAGKPRAKRNIVFAQAGKERSGYFSEADPKGMLITSVTVVAEIDKKISRNFLQSAGCFPPLLA